jgi:hypothetical protein
LRNNLTKTAENMGKKFSRTEKMFDQEVSFTYDRTDMVWSGDYTIHQFGEDSDHDYPGDSETEITIDWTNCLIAWDHVSEDYKSILPTKSIIATIENKIEELL